MNPTFALRPSKSPVAVLWRHRDLIRQLTWREITGRYRSSLLGFLWSFITPLVSLVLYTFVFGVIFEARWPGARTENLSEFGLILFAGLTAFALFSECVTRAPSLITSSPNYVKKVVFPLEVLPVSVLGAALFHAGISILVLTAAQVVIRGSVVPTVALVPLVLLPLACITLGVSWVVASLGVFVRDIGHTVALVTQVLFFATPIFYSLEVVPEPFRSVLAWNPLTPIIDNMRRAAVMGVALDWYGWTVSLVLGVVVLVLGHMWFIKTKRGFADVL